MNYGYVLTTTDEWKLHHAILIDMYNQAAMGWPPYVEQKFAIQDSQWLVHMLLGIEM